MSVLPRLLNIDITFAWIDGLRIGEFFTTLVNFGFPQLGIRDIRSRTCFFKQKKGVF